MSSINFNFFQKNLSHQKSLENQGFFSLFIFKFNLPEQLFWKPHRYFLQSPMPLYYRKALWIYLPEPVYFLYNNSAVLPQGKHSGWYRQRSKDPLCWMFILQQVFWIITEGINWFWWINLQHLMTIKQHWWSQKILAKFSEKWFWKIEFQNKICSKALIFRAFLMFEIFLKKVEKYAWQCGIPLLK